MRKIMRARKPMAYTCGWPVDTAAACVRTAAGLSHSPLLPGLEPVSKAAEQATGFPTIEQLLSPVCTHVLGHISSVTGLLLHSMHRPYYNYYNVYKSYNYIGA
jgi:hypothetical protein